MTNNRFLLLPLILIAIIGSTSLLSSWSYAQESKSFAVSGVIEIGGNISYRYSSYVSAGSELFNSNFISFQPYVGYFITDNIELGINPLSISSSWNSNSKNTSYSIFLAPAYNFKTERTVYPFIEAQLGYIAQTSSFDGTSDPTLDGFSWGGRAGIKYAFTGHGLLNLGVQYQQLTYNLSGSTSRNGTNAFMFSAGFSFWL